MQISVNKDKKFIIVWLTKEETETAEDLLMVRRICKEKKYKMIICHSGYGNLTELTGLLLQHNYILS